MLVRYTPILLLLACGSTPVDSGTPTGSTTATSSVAATATKSAEVGSVFHVTWSTEQAGDSWVEFGLDGSFDHVTPTLNGATEHEHTLLGMKAGRTYNWRAVTQLADGTQLQSDGATLTTDVPSGMAPLTLIASEPGNTVSEGYIQFSQIENDGDTFAVIIDGEGDVVWWKKGDPNTMIVTSRPSSDGSELLFSQYDLGQTADVGKLFRIRLDTLNKVETRLFEGHHDFHLWPDGTVGFLSYVTDDPNSLATDAIREVPEGATDTTTPDVIYSFLDDYPHDPWFVCEHMPGWAGNPSYEEWTHSNSLMVVDDDHYFVMSKFHDSVLKIARATGTVVWQMNGLYSDFSGPGGSQLWNSPGESLLWTHAHMSHLWLTPDDPTYEGCMVVFDNGYHLTPEVSSAVEVCWDEDTMEATEMWRYVEPNGGFTPLMGDVRKLDSTYLIGWANVGHIDEVSPEGNVLWRVDLGQGAVSGRLQPLSTLYP